MIAFVFIEQHIMLALEPPDSRAPDRDTVLGQDSFCCPNAVGVVQ